MKDYNYRQSLANAQQVKADDRARKRAYYAQRCDWHSVMNTFIVDQMISGEFSDTDTSFAMRRIRDCAHFGILALEVRA